MQDGGRTLVLHLRQGMKWTDGKPFTADDFVFWYEDIYRNKDLCPTPVGRRWRSTASRARSRRSTTYTVKFKFAEPYYLLPDVLAGSTALGGQALQGCIGMGGYAPAHYLKQFHPKYVGQAELDKKVKDAKFDNWVRMFMFKNDWALNPELPGAHALEDRRRRSTRRRGRSSATRTASGSTPTATSCRTSTRSS